MFELKHAPYMRADTTHRHQDRCDNWPFSLVLLSTAWASCLPFGLDHRYEPLLSNCVTLKKIVQLLPLDASAVNVSTVICSSQIVYLVSCLLSSGHSFSFTRVMSVTARSTFIVFGLWQTSYLSTYFASVPHHNGFKVHYFFLRINQIINLATPNIFAFSLMDLFWLMMPSDGWLHWQWHLFTFMVNNRYKCKLHTYLLLVK